ncbi:MAG TPA: tetratricopeptide repeat protein [Bacteroidales bacterium]|nr:tetratricopeptide repeat protein [Bacteroidales bacterium]
MDRTLSIKPLHLAIILAVVTFIAFFPSLKNDFVNTWDDNNYVTENPKIRGLDGAHLKQMFTRQVNGTYVPLALLTYALEYRIAGNDPAPYHRTNLLLHLISTLLIFQLFRLMKIDPLYAAFGALLFGLHPMRVESVAWISERKDVLYGLFYIAAMVCYVRHIRRENENSRYLWLSMLFFLLSLLSKMSAVTLPLSLLAIDYFMGRPVKLNLLKEKIPYFILSLIFGLGGLLIIFWISRKSGLLKANEMTGLGDRFLYGIYSLNGYLVKFFAPVNLSAMYPYPEFKGVAKILFYLLNPLLLLGTGYLVWRTARHTRALAAGALFFFINVVFLLQIFAVGSGFFADRYTYIPYIGLFLAVAWVADYAVTKQPRLRFLVLPVLAVACLACLVLTFNRCKVWKNDETLWSDVISRYPDRMAAPYADRGVYYMSNGSADLAAADFTRALSIDPQFEIAYTNRGILYGMQGKLDLAISDFTKAIAINPGNAKTYNNRGVAYGNAGFPVLAIADFLKVIQLDPHYSSAYLNLGNVYFRQKEFDRAIAFCRQGSGINPMNPDFPDIIGNCFLEKGEPEQAPDAFRRSLALDPSGFDAMLGLSVAYYLQNNKDDAKRWLDQARMANNELTFGMAGLKSLEKSGYYFGEKKRSALEKMFSEFR